MRFLILSLLLINIASAQVSRSWLFGNPDYIQLSVFDARSKGMGNTSITNLAENLTIFNNPARIGATDNIEIAFNSSYKNGNEKIDDHTPTNLDLNSLINSFAISYSPPKFHHDHYSIAFGMSTTAMYNFYGFNGLSKMHEFSFMLSPGLGVNIADRFYFGFNYSFLPSDKLKYKRTEPIYTGPFDSYNYLDYWNLEAKANSMKLGIIGVIADFLSVSFVYLPQSTYKQAKIKIHSVDSYDTTYEELTIFPDYEFKVPACLQYGVSLFLLDKIRVNGEYHVRRYSKLKNLYYPDYRYKNGSNYRLGVEYIWDIIFRAGYFNDEVLNDFIRDDCYGITAGLGFRDGPVCMDAFAEYKSWQYLAISDYGDIIGEKYENSFGMGLSVVYWF